ncbi:peptidase S8/S53 domain-containing protein [Flagelloscypha sp. PMI_526]|nr:peptidase S8/S53 domain-containing protein [Flagelloscypha sp. PMI_526]
MSWSLQPDCSRRPDVGQSNPPLAIELHLSRTLISVEALLLQSSQFPSSPMQFRSLATLLALVAVAQAVPSRREAPSSEALISHSQGWCNEEVRFLGILGLLVPRQKIGPSSMLLLVGWDTNEDSDADITSHILVENTPETMKVLKDHPEVLHVEEDHGMKASSTTQTDAPWGLQRLNTQDPSPSRITLLNYTYTYDENSAGVGVDVYMLDTGIRVTHTTFEGRAAWGATFVSDHIIKVMAPIPRGTVGGARWGVAKNVHLIAVKVLDDTGYGDFADFILAIDWVVDQATVTGRPSIISASLGGGATIAVDDAVAAATAAGIHVVVAAMNENVDAVAYSPARAPSAITVGASTNSDAKASFSNYGAVVDIFGPGYGVASSWNTADDAFLYLDGTSMATPHVSGLAAYLISAYGNRSPADMQDLIKSVGLPDKLSGLPDGTPNLLVHLPTSLP